VNLPNTITAGRILAAPFIAALPFIASPGARAVAFALYVIAALTDYYDGMLARTRNLITDLGERATRFRFLMRDHERVRSTWTRSSPVSAHNAPTNRAGDHAEPSWDGDAMAEGAVQRRERSSRHPQGGLTVSRNGAAHDEGPKPRLWPFVA